MPSTDVKRALDSINKEAKVKKLEPVDTSTSQILFVEIIGKAGIGKTHLACTFPSKVGILLTPREAKDAYATVNKFIKQGKAEAYICNTYTELIAAMNELLKDEEIKTIVIDSSAEIGILIQEEFDRRNVSLVSNVGGKVAPLGWGNVYAEFDRLFARCAMEGKNLVMTSKIEEDGSVKRFKRNEYSMMIVLTLTLGRYDAKAMKYVDTDKIYAHVTKNQFVHPTKQEQFIEDPTYEKIVERCVNT